MYQPPVQIRSGYGARYIILYNVSRNYNLSIYQESWPWHMSEGNPDRARRGTTAAATEARPAAVTPTATPAASAPVAKPEPGA